jgi:hypothetical protein
MLGDVGGTRREACERRGVARQQTVAAAIGVSAPFPLAGPAATSAREVASAAADRLRVARSASRSSWLSGSVEGRKVVRRQVRAGEQQGCDVPRELGLTASDAAAITLRLNGAAKPLGKAGELVTTRLSPPNFTDHRVPR